MDLTQIASAARAYERGGASEDARLEFFCGLYTLEQRHADEAPAYAVPDAADLTEWYWSGKPVLEQAPVTIEAARFSAIATEAARYLADHAGLAAPVADALRRFDGDGFAAQADLALAGRQPAAFLEGVLSGQGEPSVPDVLQGPVLGTVLTATLRALLQPASEAVCAHVPAPRENHNHPLNCPVCGMPAAASYVGGSAGTEGAGRRQYCGLCGAQWDFERIRCGCCGTRNQGHLHYFHTEDDPAHRLLTCDECDGYERVAFEAQLPGHLSMEVEDVVMAPLDGIAHDPRFRAEAASVAEPAR